MPTITECLAFACSISKGKETGRYVELEPVPFVIQVDPKHAGLHLKCSMPQLVCFNIFTAAMLPCTPPALVMDMANQGTSGQSQRATVRLVHLFCRTQRPAAGKCGQACSM